MGWRYRKSVKVAPGTRVNFSTSGVSVTNRVGKTGLYHRTQLVGGRKKRGGCLGSVIGFVLVLGLIGALFGGGDKSEKALPSPEPSAALVAVSPSPTSTPEPTPEPTPSPSPVPTTEPTVEPLAEPEPTVDPDEALRARVHAWVEEYENTEQDFVLNTSTMRFHKPGCRGVREMSASNRQDFHGTRAEVTAMGYTPCGICKP